MDDLIEALTIFRKYMEPGSYNFARPTHCEHDVLMVSVTAAEWVSGDDKDRLERLGFSWSDEYECYVSYRFGSA